MNRGDHFKGYFLACWTLWVKFCGQLVDLVVKWAAYRQPGWLVTEIQNIKVVTTSGTLGEGANHN